MANGAGGRSEGGTRPGWGGTLPAPVAAGVRTHPWLGVAGGIAAGALLGALSRRTERRDEVRLLLDGRTRVVVRPWVVEVPVEEDGADEAAVAEESRFRRLARSAADPIRHLWEEEEPEEQGPFERVRAAVQENVERLAERLPRRRPPSRVERLRRAVADALPGADRGGVGRRLRRAFR